MFEIASPDTVRHYLTDLQSRIAGAVVALDGGTLVVDAWEKAPGEMLQGNGITQILENGAVFERAGCGFSHVRGPRLPPSATQQSVTSEVMAWLWRGPLSASIIGPANKRPAQPVARRLAKHGRACPRQPANGFR